MYANGDVHNGIPPLESMFNYAHIDFKTLKLSQWLTLIAYFPFGVVLLIFRLFLFFILGSLLVLSPFQFFFPRIMYKLAMPLFGIVVRVSFKGPKDPLRNVVIVANHRSSFDVFPFLAETNVNVLIGKSCVVL